MREQDKNIAEKLEKRALLLEKNQKYNLSNQAMTEQQNGGPGDLKSVKQEVP